MCPARAKFKYILNIRGDEDTTASDRGTEIHELAEVWLKSKKLLQLAPIFDHFRKDFLALRKLGALAEHPLSFSENWEPAGNWDGDGNDDEESWLRMKLDVFAHVNKRAALVVDFKTGKVRDYHELQTGLYALAVFIAYPKVEEVFTELWYIDAKKKVKGHYKREQMRVMKKMWERRVEPMFNDRVFAPCPNYLCNNYCPYNAKSGLGLCKYGGA